MLRSGSGRLRILFRLQSLLAIHSFSIVRVRSVRGDTPDDGTHVRLMARS